MTRQGIKLLLSWPRNSQTQNKPQPKDTEVAFKNKGNKTHMDDYCFFNEGNAEMKFFNSLKSRYMTEGQRGLQGAVHWQVSSSKKL
jgi:hypothetical protein